MNDIKNHIRMGIVLSLIGFFIIFVTATIADSEKTLNLLKYANDYFLHFSAPTFCATTTSMVLLAFLIFFSPLGSIRVGGSYAEPLISRYSWFAIILGTTVGIGILFWSTSEPLIHLYIPPNFMNLNPISQEAHIFALSTMYFNWGFSAYAIFAIPTIIFAIAHYNYKLPFRVSSFLYPLFSKKLLDRLGPFLDFMCLCTFIAGISGNMGCVVLMLKGANVFYHNPPLSSGELFLLIMSIVLLFVISAVSGLTKGIKYLSSINLFLLLLLAAFIFYFGPSENIIHHGMQSFEKYIINFLGTSVYALEHSRDQWIQSWSIFYWSNWFAWAPITAMFLGRIAKGYTIREILVFNFFLPVTFSCAWITVFAETAIDHSLSHDGNLFDVLRTQGSENVIFHLLSEFPWPSMVVLSFTLIAILSYITAADSSTDAMSQISVHKISEKKPKSFSVANNVLKVIYGFIIGFISWYFAAFSGIEGITILNNLGGLPALVLLVLGVLSFMKSIVLKDEEFGYKKL